jgi:hypothetical protein
MTATATTLDRAHPIGVAAARIDDLLKDVRDVPTWSMAPAEAADTAMLLTQVKAQLAEVEARVIDRVEQAGVAADAGATSTANWLAHTTKQTRTSAHRLARFAAALANEAHEPVRRSLADGELLVDQAEVIIAAIDALPVDLVDDDLRAQAQVTLIGYAAVHDAKALRILGKRILEVVAPEVGEAHEAKQLDKEEREADKAASLWAVDDGHGKAHGRFTIPSAHWAMLKKALLATAAPKHRAAVDGQAPEPGLPSAHRLGQAFTEYIETYPEDLLPNAGGVSATVVVTMTLDTLIGGLKTAQLDTGHRISPGLARRWACEAGTIPAVLGSKSQVLDLGRKTRFHTKPQRIALAIEQQGCTAEGCDWPPGMCHTHHHQPWAFGGTTDLKNGRLLCPRHHARAHDPGYTMTRLPEGKVRFHRRT